MTDKLKKAFIAGFMATAEGYNGEYAGSMSTSPEEEASKQFEKWSCERDGGHTWGEWDCKDARHGNRLRCTRYCQDCPESEWEFRDNNERLVRGK